MKRELIFKMEFSKMFISSVTQFIFSKRTETKQDIPAKQMHFPLTFVTEPCK